MTMIAKVKINWSKKAPTIMVIVAYKIVKDMTDNDKFISPKIALNLLSDAAHNLSKLFASRKNGTDAKSLLKAEILILDNYLHKQAEYVDGIAQGDAEIIHSAGFESTSDKRTAGSKAKIAEGLVIEAMLNGKINAKVDKIDNATNYCFILTYGDSFNVKIENGMIAIPNGTKAYIVNTTKCTTSFFGMEPMKQVWVSVLASSPTGFTAFCPAATTSTII